MIVSQVDPFVLLTIAIALGYGGFVKGVTGTGAPLVAIPIIAAFYDVSLAILVMVVPNIAMNVMQVLRYRANIRPAKIAVLMSVGAIPGMFFGTYLLSSAPQDLLLLGLGLFLVAFLALRLFDPHFQISQRVAIKLSLPTGILGGVMQGAVGTSGPLALLFLSGQNLARPMFIGTASAFYLTNSVIQAPALWGAGLLSLGWIGISTLAMLPVWLGMLSGGRAGQKLSAEAFNRWILVLLAILAVRLIWRGLA